MNHGRKPVRQVIINNQLAQYRGWAHKRDLEWKLTPEEFQKLIFQNCSYCGISPCTKSPSYKNEVLLWNGIDRVNNTQGYILSNCVTACKICNHAKGTLSVADFLAWAKRLGNAVIVQG